MSNENGEQLWLALGKTNAEKAAWRKSMELKVKLVAICPGLLMAPSFPYAHKDTSIPYLKGNDHSDGSFFFSIICSIHE